MTGEELVALGTILQDAISRLGTVKATNEWSGIDDPEAPAVKRGRGRPADAATIWLRHKMTDQRNPIRNAGGPKSQAFKTWLVLRAFDDDWDVSAFASWLSGDLERRQQLGHELNDAERDILWLAGDLYESFRKTLQVEKRKNPD